MMKLLTYLIFCMGLILISASCSKYNSLPLGGASLTVVNAISGSVGLITNFTDDKDKVTDTFRYYNTALQIAYGSYQEISSFSGNTPLSLSDISDSLHPLFRGTLDLSKGSSHTLFVMGTINSPDTFYTSDGIPYYRNNDSVTGVRFVNLLASKNTINISLSATPNKNIASGIGYKMITSFAPLDATAQAQLGGYTFEFRDAATDSVLATYSLNIALYKSQTLAIYGTASSGMSVTGINNY